ncbi:MAG: radical SAM family heme chaperone HemW [Bacteroidales bacterium]|nr:radical SAM family heme chaperone HemW [Bacteroidales bacterium]
MAAFYIHIPYCKQVCFYCDFHFRVAMKDQSAMLKAMLKEMAYRKDYLRLNGESGKIPIDTLYFGGGTPSLLSIAELSMLLKGVQEFCIPSPTAEITLEANPDDLTENYLSALRNLGFNRLSIGVQSFCDEDLRLMNRRHTAQEAWQAVERAQRKGFDNINMDLIYGLPSMNLQRWQHNLDKALALNVPHLSAYHLTIEPQTVFGVRQRKGADFSVAEEDSAAQFELLTDACEKAGYEHYEISNFARPGCYSRHNTAYWRGIPYIGIGPSAHSCNGASRQWNVSNNHRYIALMDNPETEEWFEREILSPSEAFNDFILTGLRTQWGVEISQIREKWSQTIADTFVHRASGYIQHEFMKENNGTYTLTRKGKLIADRIASDLFEV